jgi:DNA-binding NarL/FixJ family response regulator
VLGLTAEGRSNAGIAHQLGISESTVEAVCALVLLKLHLAPDPDANRRVLAVLILVRA